MGSHNFTYNALVRNDETFLLIDDRNVHDAFVNNFGGGSGPTGPDARLQPGWDRGRRVQ